MHLRLRFPNLGKPRTTGLCGRAAGACDCGPLSVLKSNGLHRPKIRLKKFSFSLKIVPAYISKKLPSQCWPKPLFIPIFNLSHKRLTLAFTAENGYTLGSLRKIAHSGLHAETGAVSDGGAITTLGAFHTFRKPCVARCQNGKLCRFWVLVGGAPKERREPRDSDAHKRIAVPRRRGPAGLRDLFRFCRNCGLYTLRSVLSMRARWGWYHYPRRALCAVETLGARLSKGFICRFLRLLSSILCAVPFSANMQISLSAISVANAFPPPTTAGLCASSRIASNRTTTVSLGCMDSSSFGCLIVLDSSSTYTTRS